ncbi:MAG: TIGR02584 family CRISPR-associated protein [Desulfobacterales bacterium]|nr:MAG: TIGR02584 family CRISPR-associated protein [Desulfobacterales bacterium]
MKRRVLLAPCGLYPQVITETLYCLYQRGRLIDEIHIITTSPGKEMVLNKMLAEGQGMFFRFCEEYGINSEEIVFSATNIHVPKNEEGKELTDIFSKEDNEKLLALTTDLVCRLTSNEENDIYFLVAGGRKTMSSCLTLAVQLYGRRQDRLFHILVSPEFESNSEFWYPPVQARMLMVRDTDGRYYEKSTANAKLYLVPIPFVSLRAKLPQELFQTSQLPGTLIASQTDQKKRLLEIDLATSVICYGGVELDMHPARLALYAFFCKAALADNKPTAREVLDQQQEIVSLYQQIGVKSINATSDTGIMNLTVENFNSYKSKIKKDLEQAFGQSAVDLVIASEGKRPDTRYGILLNRKKIVFI